MPRLRVIPAPLLLWLLAGLTAGLLLWCVLGANTQVSVSQVGQVGAIGVITLLGLALLDIAITQYQWRRTQASLTRILPAALALGSRRSIQLCLELQGDEWWQLTLFDGCDNTLLIESQPTHLSMQGSTRSEFTYQVTPTARGEVTFAPAQLRVRSRWRLLDMLTHVGKQETRRVYPDFAQVARYAWLAGDRRLAEIGLKTFRQRGEGTDFKQLAEYQRGDSPRHIDWKATLRFDKPIVRQFQNERDQAVVFLLDCGRRLRADDSQTQHASHFDQVLNATLLLSYVALRQGDAVGAMTFGTPIGHERWFAPRKGSSALQGLMNELHAVQPSVTHSDYLLAARDLLKRLKKRALVIVLTNFREEDATELGQALRLLRTRHLVLTASMRERVVRELIEQPLHGSANTALDIAGAHLHEQGRRHAFNKLAARDALMLDAEPEQLGIELVNRYEAVKRAGMV